MTGLSPRQAETLEFIRDHVRRRGCSPTLAEIGQHLGIASVSRLQEILEALEKKKAITRGHGDARAIRVAGTCPTCGENK